jgi:hypothetical protein
MPTSSSATPKDPSVFGVATEGEELGGGEDLFVGATIKGELVSTVAHKYGTPRAPFFFGTEKNYLLSAIFAREDNLLGRTQHVYTSFAPLGHRIRHGSNEPLGCAGGNFTHSWDGHKINEVVRQATLMLDAKLPNRFIMI